MAILFRQANNRLFLAGLTQWAPRTAKHDPNPPITLQTDGAFEPLLKSQPAVVAGVMSLGAVPLDVDAVTSEQYITPGTTVTLSHTCSGTDRGLFVHVGLSAGTPPNISGVTYNGVAMTQLWNFSAEAFFRDAGFYLINPASGANNIVVTFSAGPDEVALGGVSFVGADQTTPTGTPVTASGSTTTASVNVSSAANEIVIDGVYVGRDGVTVDASQTQRWQEPDINASVAGATSTEVGAATTTMSWALDATGFIDAWLIGAVPIKPVGAGAIAATGTPDAQSSIVAGTASVNVNAEGVPASQSATLAGTAEAIISVTGDLASQASIVAGTGIRNPFVGDIASQASIIAGVVEVKINATGALAVSEATVSGIVEPIITVSGALVSSEAVIASEGSINIAAVGTLQAPDAVVAGVSSVLVAVNGTLLSEVATTEGVFSLDDAEAHFAGAPASQDAVVLGTSSVNINASGELAAQNSTTLGAFESIASFSGALAASNSSVLGTFEAVGDFIGALVAQSSAISGLFEAVGDFTGDIEAQNSTTEGEATTDAALIFSGALISQDSTVLSAFEAITSVNGILEAQNSTLEAIYTPIPTPIFIGDLISASPVFLSTAEPIINAVGDLVQQPGSVHPIAAQMQFLVPPVFDGALHAGIGNIEGVVRRIRKDNVDVSVGWLDKYRFRFQVRRY